WTICTTTPCTNSRIGGPPPLRRCRRGSTRVPWSLTRTICRFIAKRWRLIRSRYKPNVSRSGETHRSERGDRSAAERDAEDCSGEHVAKEVRAQHDARNRDAQRQKKQRPFQGRIEV